MKKKSRTLGILLGILIVLLAIFLGLKKWNSVKEEAEAEKEEAESIIVYETDELVKMAYADNAGKSMEFEKTDSEWKYVPDTTIGLVEDTMSGLESTFSSIKADREISSPDSLADYGLEEAQYRLTLTGDDSEEHVFLVGNSVGEDYYFMEDGEEIVYTVSSNLVNQMVWQISGVAEKDVFVSVTEDNFVREVVTKADGTETIYEMTDDEQSDEDAEAEEEEAEEADEEETDVEGQDDKASAVAGGLTGFYFTDCADYHVTDETLADYGLDEAQRTTVVLTYKDVNDDNKEKELTFYVGSKDEDETYYYVQLDGSQMVNRVVVSSVESALGW